MRLFQLAIVSALCCYPAVALHCDDNTGSAAMINDQTIASAVIPLPEAAIQYSSPTPVYAIVVDRNGNMYEVQYIYDPFQGGIVINNYYQIAGPEASIYFPAYGVGFLWWGGFWVDSYGYYWNGSGFGYVSSFRWGNRWNNYWHNDWNNRWDRHNGGRGRENFHHRGGANRPANTHRRDDEKRHKGGGRGGHGGGRQRGHGKH